MASSAKADRGLATIASTRSVTRRDVLRVVSMSDTTSRFARARGLYFATSEAVPDVIENPGGGVSERPAMPIAEHDRLACWHRSEDGNTVLLRELGHDRDEGGVRRPLLPDEVWHQRHL